VPEFVEDNTTEKVTTFCNTVQRFWRLRYAF